MRVEIDQVNGFILDVIPKDLQIVAVVKGVPGNLSGNVARERR